MTSCIRGALSEAIEFAEQDGQALTPAGDAMVQRWRDTLSAPDVGVGLTRFGFVRDDWADGGSRLTLKEDGEYVRFEDVAPLIAASRVVPADVELETNAEQRRRIEVEIGEVSVRLLGEIIELVTHREDEPTWGNKIAMLIRDELFPREAALAASTAREKAKDAEIERLNSIEAESHEGQDIIREQAEEIAGLTKLLTSIKAYALGALDDADDLPDGWTPDYEVVLVQIGEKIDAALSGRKPDTKEGT